MFFQRIIKGILRGSIIFLLIGLLVGLFYFADTYLKFKKAAVAGELFFNSIFNNKVENFDRDFSLWQKNWLSFKTRVLEIDRLSRGYFKKKYDLEKQLDLVGKITAIIPEIVARDNQKTYFVLLQNNLELRPTGGFLGSYAKLVFKNGGLEEVAIEDIYVPDGQIAGHVEPPWPIQEAFKQGWWKLRDSNWDPDFPRAVKTIDWFFQKGKEEKSAGMIALNLLTVKKILKILGPIRLVDYQQSVNEENFYQIAQSYTETNFFPGSTQKKDIMSSLGKALLARFKKVNSRELMAIGSGIYEDLNQRQILLSFDDPILKEIFHNLGWDGSIKNYLPYTNKQLNDYIFLVETNLGANKANCCLERRLEQEVDLADPEVIKEKVKILFKYQSGYSSSITPLFPGQVYINFLRVYLPAGAKLTDFSINGEKKFPVINFSWGKFTQEIFFEEVREDLGLKAIGFFWEIPPLAETFAEIEYEIKKPDLPDNWLSYQLTVQKQSGIEFIPYQLTLRNGSNIKKVEKLITEDEEFLLNLEILKK